MYNPPLVPDVFETPQRLSTERMVIRPLTINDAVKDYDAVMTSLERLNSVFDPRDVWPDDLTLEQNMIELAWHQVETQLRSSFTYTVMTPDETRTLGCIYIYPTPAEGYDAEVTMWVRQSEAETGLDDHLFSTVKDWLANWPIKPAYPGRDISFEEWAELIDK